MLVAKLWCELCINCDVHVNVFRSSYNLAVLHLYCNSFFIRDVHGEFGLILPERSSIKVRDFFCVSRVITLYRAVSA